MSEGRMRMMRWSAFSATNTSPASLTAMPSGSARLRATTLTAPAGDTRKTCRMWNPLLTYTLPSPTRTRYYFTPPVHAR